MVNTKNQKGISLLTLIITIIAIIILALMVIRPSDNSVNEAIEAKFKQEITEVKKGVETVKLINSKEGLTEEILNKNFKKVEVENPPKNFVSFDNDKITGYVVDLKEIDYKKIKTGQGYKEVEEGDIVEFEVDDVYVYDKVGTVYYAKGLYLGDEEEPYFTDGEKETRGPIIKAENTEGGKIVIEVTTTNDGEITSVTVGDKEATKVSDGVYEITVDENGSYIITAKEEAEDGKGGTSKTTVNVTKVSSSGDVGGTGAQAPTTGSVTINSNEVYTHEKKATLYIETDADLIYIKHVTNGTVPQVPTKLSSGWRRNVSETPIYLSEGQNDVYVWFRNSGNDTILSDNASIVLDSVPPTRTKPTVEIFDEYSFRVTSNQKDVTSGLRKIEIGYKLVGESEYTWIEVPDINNPTIEILNNLPGENYQIVSRAEDNSGLSSESLDYMTGELSGIPSGIIIENSPKEGYTAKSTVTITYPENADSPAFERWYRIDGGEWQVAEDNEVTLFIEDNITIEAVVVRKTSTETIFGDTVSLTINNIDATNPIIGFVELDTENAENGADFKAKIELTDYETGIIEFAVTNEDKEPETWENIGNPSKIYEAEFDANVGDIYYIWAKDEAGNKVKKMVEILAIDLINDPDVSISIDSEEYDYTGLEIKPKVIITYKGFELTEGEDFDVKYEENVNAGTAKITITGKDKYEGIKEIEFTINPVEPTITLENKTYYYNGEIQESPEAKVTGTPNGTYPNGEITYTYYKDKDLKTKTGAADGATENGGAPSAEGTYYVVAQIEAKGNYKEATSNIATFQIQSKPVLIKLDTDQDGENETQITVYYGGKYGDLPAANKVGYTFEGWYTPSGEKVENTTKVKIQEEHELTAKFTPNHDTDYTVNHWKQNITGADTENESNYTIFETENLEGTTNTSVTPDVKTYEGFTSPSEITRTIKPDGSLVIDYYYKRNVYTIIFDSNGGSNVPSIIAKYEKEVVAPNAPTREGYTFAGWDKEIPTKMPAEDITIKAKWTAIEYTISYDLDGGTVTGNPEKYTIETEDFTLTNPSKTGYTFAGWTGTDLDAATINVTIAKGSLGNRSYKATWKANENTPYKVEHWLQNIDGAATEDDQNYTLFETDELEGTTASIVTPDVKNYEGFTAPATKQVTIAADGTTVVKYYYKRNTYTITFNTNGGSTIDAITAKYGASVSAPANPTREGYTFAGWDKTIPSTMPVDGMTINSKWNAIEYTITYNLDGGTQTTNPDKYTIETDDITLAKPNKVGYIFKGWTGTDLSSATMNVTIAKGSIGNRTYTATWEKSTNTAYKVEHYKQTIEGADTENSTNYAIVTADTQNLIGTTGAEVTPQVKNYDGFTSPSAKTVTIAADGNTVVKYYYKRNSYTITFNSNGGSSVESITAKYEASVSAPANPTKTGYTFAGWDKEFPAKMPLNGMELTAKWEANTNTAYKVEHYKQTVSGADEENSTNYTIVSADTQNLTGTTGASVTPDVKTYEGFTSPSTKTVTIAADGSTVVKYYYTRNSYEVTLNPTGGIVTPTTLTVKYGGTYAGLPAATSSIATFLGWFTAETSGEKVTETTTVGTSAEGQTLYAKWNVEAVAIYSETDDSLTFLKPETIPVEGNEYNDKKITNVYTRFEKSTYSNYTYIPWYEKNLTIKNVIVEDEISPISTENWFYGFKNVTSIDITKLNTSKVKSMSNMFYDCSKLTTLDVREFDTSNVTNMENMFYNCSGLTTLDLSGFDTSNVTNMKNMFYNCSGLTTLDLSGFDTVKVTNMQGMFYNCSLLTMLNVSNFDTRNVTSMENMFENCNGILELNVSKFDTRNVTSMRNMFANCKALTTLDVSSFDTRKVTTMYNMFASCSNLKKLDISSKHITINNNTFDSWDTCSVETMNSMFYSCIKLLTLDISHFDTTNVTNMYNMFGICNNLTSLNISGNLKTLNNRQFTSWNTSKVTMMYQMFLGCERITKLDISSINNSNVTNMGRMFVSMNRLQEITLGKEFRFLETDTYLPTQSKDYIDGANGKWYNVETGDGYSPSELATNHGGAVATYSAIPVIKVTFNANGGTVTGETSKIVKYNETYGTLPTASKVGYTFAGWYKESSFTNKVTSETKVTAKEAHSLYANWTPNNYTYNIVYKSNSGTELGTATIEKAFGTTETINPQAFTGYTSPASKSVTWDSEAAKTIEFTYTPISYTISYTLNGGTNASGAVANYTIEDEITLPTPTKNGYTFMGWFVASNFSGTAVTKIAKGTTGNKTFYAKFVGSYAIYSATDNSLTFYKNSDSVIKGSTYKNKAVTEIYTGIETDTYTLNTDVPWYNYANNITSAVVADEISPVSIRKWFDRVPNLTTVDFDKLDTSKVTTMHSVFQLCSKLTAIDTSDWDTSKVTDMTAMFNGCSTLTTIDVSGWDTSKVTGMYGMFNNCTGLQTLDVSGWNTASVNNMDSMFQNCSGLKTINVSGWRTPLVTTMQYMFNGCKLVEELDVSGFRTPNVTTLRTMFQNCNKVTTLDVSEWVTTNVTDMGYLFYGCSNVTNLNLGKFNTSKVTNMTGMFGEMNKLEEITLGANFSFKGAGTTALTTLIAPSSTYIPGANGTWTNMATGANYAPANIPNNTAATYTAVAKYTITFNTNGGTEIAPITARYGASVSAPANPTRAGYTFAGWDKTIPTTMPAANMTINASWNPITYNITYTLNGGSVSGNPTTYTIETTDFTLTNPTKTGYTFAGWTGTSLSSATKTVTVAQGSIGERSYTATWTPNENTAYKVEHYKQTITGADTENSTNYALVTADTQNLTGTTDTKVTPQVKTYTGFTSPSAKEATIAPEGNTVVKYYYKRNSYTLTFNTNGGSAVESIIAKYEASVSAPEEPTKTGYTFAGWDKEVPSTMPVDGMELNATWTPNNYTITYTLNEGTNTSNAVTSYTIEDEVTLPTPTRSGFTFLGWFETADFSGTAVTKIAKGSTGNKTYYAKWYGAFAVYSETDNSLRFYKNSDNVTKGSTYNGKTVTEIYTGVEIDVYYVDELDIYLKPWEKYEDDITTVVIEDIISPVSTKGWFSSMANVTSIDVAKLDTSNVTDMTDMFSYCTNLTTLDLSSFDTTNVTNMYMMFNGCSSLTTLNLSSFNTTNVTTMSGMFGFCNSFTTLNLSSFNTTNVITMRSMFSSCNSLTTVNLNSFDTSNVTNMDGMFYSCSSLTSLDLTSFDTTNALDMSSMFYGCSSLTSLDLSSFDTSNVSSMSSMFDECSSLTSIDLSSFDTSNVSSMSRMFASCNSLTSLDLSSFDTSNVSSMSYMFGGCSKLQEITLGSKFSFTGNGSTSCTLPAPSASSIPGANGKWYNTATNVGYEPANVPSNTAATYTAIAPIEAFAVYSEDDSSLTFYKAAVPTKGSTYNGKTVTEVYTGFETATYTSQSRVPWYAIRENITTVTVQDEIAPVSTAYWFYQFKNTTKLDVTNLKTVNVTDMKYMFYYCGYNVSSFEIIGLNDWNTAKVTDLSYMFYYAGYNANSWNIGELNNWDVSNVLDMSSMFHCASTVADSWYIGDISSWNTGKVKNMSKMFYEAGFSAKTWNVGNLSNWNVSSVTNMHAMFFEIGFSRAITWTIGDLANWNTSNVTDMSYMFNSCSSLKELNLTKWITSKVTNMSYMFNNCSGLTNLDLSNFDTTNVTNMTDMFLDMYKLQEITLGSKFSFTGNGSTSCTLPTPSATNITGADGKWYNIATGTGYEPASVPGSTFATYSAIPRYIVTFQGNGGTIDDLGSTYTTRVVTLGKTYGENAVDFPAAIWDGYKFLGWFTKETEGEQITSTTTVDTTASGQILYAHWEGGIAVYSEDDSSLTFYNAVIPKAGSTYNGKTATAVYTGVEETEYTVDLLAPWNEHSGDITSVTVADEISPKSTAFWFYNLENVTSIDVAKLNTSKVTNMRKMFSNTGINNTTFEIIGLNNWNTANVTDMYDMFYKAGYSASTFELDLSKWNTSNVTTMAYMFQKAGYSATTWSIGDISNWNTSNVINMCSMFSNAGYNASTFELDLSKWNTSNVTTMAYMFQKAGYSATTWNIGDLSQWDTSNVTDMIGMFNRAGYSASTWNIGDLSNWNTSSVKNMNGMFIGAGYSASTFDIGDLSNWDTSNVTDMYAMFNAAGYNTNTFDIGDLSEWDTSNVTNMNYMFYNAGYSASTWNIGNLSQWDTSNVTDMNGMFNGAGYSASTWNIGNLSQWDTSNVTDMNRMFNGAGYSASTFELDLSQWDTSNVTDMNRMFSNAGYSASIFDIGDLSKWDTSNVLDMNIMFNRAGYSASTWNIGDLASWNISNVKDMNKMFLYAGYSANTWNIGDLSNWNTSNVTDMSYVFNMAGYNSTPFSLNLSNWDTSKVSNMTGMFAGMRKLKEITLGSKFSFTGNGSTSCTLPTPSSSYIEGADGKWYNVDTGTGYAPANVPSNTAATYTAISPNKAFAVYSATDNSLTFYKEETVPTAGSTYNGKTATAVYTGIEENTYSETSVPWYSYRENITKVVMNATIKPVSTAYWFSYFTKVTSLDVSKLDTSDVTNMLMMFYRVGYNVNTLNLDLSNLDTSKVTSMRYMFCLAGYNSNTFKITGLDKWNTSSVEDMAFLFSGAGVSATTWDIGNISNWNTSNVRTLQESFDRTGYSVTTEFKLDFSNWDTSKVTSMSGMFEDAGYNASSFTLDLSNFDTSKVSYISSMFSDCRKLKEITLGSKFSFTGNGSSSCTLPTPSASYITGADGKWYNVDTGVGYAPANVPSNTAATYTAISPSTTLASKVQIGDYVNYPVNYTNVAVYMDDDSRRASSEYVGWRVIDIDGDTVKLISAGVPLAHNGNGASSSTIVKALTTNFKTTSYARSGFSGSLSTVFNNSYTSSVRSITKDDLDKVYGATTSDGTYVYNVYNNLLAVPSDTELYANYRLATAIDTNTIWEVSFAGGVQVYGTYLISGVRPVVTLKTGVETTGQDSNGVWQLK